MTNPTPEAVERAAQAIWSKTYLHDTLLPWSEIKPGTMHHRRVIEAAADALSLPAEVSVPAVVQAARKIDYYYDLNDLDERAAEKAAPKNFSGATTTKRTARRGDRWAGLAEKRSASAAIRLAAIARK